jgi:acetyl esterase
MAWFWDQFLGDPAAHDDARAVLMRQRWERRPPPTTVCLAAHDPLHDEGVAYAGLLRAAGAPVTLQVAPDMAHGFLRYCWVNAPARRHVEAAADSLLAQLGAARAP